MVIKLQDLVVSLWHSFNTVGGFLQVMLWLFCFKPQKSIALNIRDF